MTQQPIASVRRGEVPKRPRTPGARERDLTRDVDYGGEVGVVTETYARQTVVDAYPPGATEPQTVTEKAYANLYAPAGWTLEPSTGDAPTGPLDDDMLATSARLLDEADRERAEAEAEAEAATAAAETERRARERAEAKAEEEAAARAAAEQENARLLAELEALRAAPPVEAPADATAPATEEPAPTGTAKARKS